MAKQLYHINADNIVAKCTAKPGNCPFEHFDSLDKAQKRLDDIFSAEFNKDKEISIDNNSVEKEPLNETTLSDFRLPVYSFSATGNNTSTVAEEKEPDSRDKINPDLLPPFPSKEEFNFQLMNNDGFFKSLFKGKDPNEVLQNEVVQEIWLRKYNEATKKYGQTKKYTNELYNKLKENPTTIGRNGKDYIRSIAKDLGNPENKTINLDDKDIYYADNECVVKIKELKIEKEYPHMEDSNYDAILIDEEGLRYYISQEGEFYSFFKKYVPSGRWR